MNHIEKKLVRVEGFGRDLVSILLVLTLVLLMTFAAVPVLAPAIVSHPGDTTVEVAPGQNFTLTHRLRWDEDVPGFYWVTIYWDYGGDNSWHFTLVENRAYFDNGDPIRAIVSTSDNGSRYTIQVRNEDGDVRNGEFNVELTLRASGPDGSPHRGGDHSISYTAIRCFEESQRTQYPAPVTVRVLARGVTVSISPGYQSGAPGEMLEYIVTIKNTGTFKDDYSLTVSDNENWGLALPENWFENVQPGENRISVLSVTVPENAPTCTEDNITVTVTGTGVENSASCIAHAALAPPTLSTPTDGTITDDNTPTFDWSDVAGAENYDLLVDNDADFSSPEIQVTVSASTYTPTVELPDDNYSWRVQARDAANNLSDWSEVWTFFVAVRARAVEVSISPSYQSGLQGATLSYTVIVTNEGALEDNYILTVSDNAGWGPTLSLTSLTVPVGDNRATMLNVTIPSGAEHGERDNIRVVAASMENAEVSASASCEAQVSILRSVEVSISPSSGSGPPGTSLTYTVTVKNTGLVEDTYTLSAVGAAGWSVSIEPTSLTLAAGATGEATLSVVVPPDVGENTSMTVNVSVRSKGDPTVIGSDTCRTIVTGAPVLELAVPLAISAFLIGAAILVMVYLRRVRPKKAARRRVLRDASLSPRY